jgi:hypothetical protein
VKSTSMNLRTGRATSLIHAATLSGLAAAYGLDLIGVLLALPAVWTAGGVLGWPAIAAGVLATLLTSYDYLSGPPRGSMRGPARRWHLPLAVLGVALYALSRWVRGTAAVPPDPVLLWSQGIAVALWAWSFLARRRALTPTQGR